MKREVLVATPHNCKYGPYNIRRDFLIAWSMSVDEYILYKKIDTHTHKMQVDVTQMLLYIYVYETHYIFMKRTMNT